MKLDIRALGKANSPRRPTSLFCFSSYDSRTEPLVIFSASFFFPGGGGDGFVPGHVPAAYTETRPEPRLSSVFLSLFIFDQNIPECLLPLFGLGLGELLG